jgi:hypothetical protein
VSWLKAGIATTIFTGLVMLAAMLALSVVQKGFEPMSLLAIVLGGAPLALLAAAPTGMLVLPAADAILDRRGGARFAALAVVGAIAGLLLPLFVIFVLKIRPPGMLGTITALLMLAGLVSGAVAGLAYAEISERSGRG